MKIADGHVLRWLYYFPDTTDETLKEAGLKKKQIVRCRLAVTTSLEKELNNDQ